MASNTVLVENRAMAGPEVEQIVADGCSTPAVAGPSSTVAREETLSDANSRRSADITDFLDEEDSLQLDARPLLGNGDDAETETSYSQHMVVQNPSIPPRNDVFVLHLK